MTENIKARDIRGECKYAFVYNIVALALVLTAEYILLPGARGIHGRYSPIEFAVGGSLTMFFMGVMEKYSMMVSGETLYEKFIITMLGSLYAYAVMCVINLVFFMSHKELVIDSVAALSSLAGVFVSDIVMHWFFCNKNRYRKQRMLIVVSDAKNFHRMKRAKYGILSSYDAWYETIEGIDRGGLGRFIKEQFPKYDAICIFDDLSGEKYRMAVSAALEMNKDLYIVPKLVDAGRANAKIAIFDDIITFCTAKRNMSAIEVFIKRAVDIAFSIVGLVVAAIPMAVIAAAIKITSPGPVFYRQTRLTEGKREFEIYKFRTMVPDAEKLSGPKFAEKHDPRVTPVGRIIRACRLDELPQFINILKGDMSLVGPRPERPVFVRQFEKEIDEYNLRFEMKAGLASLSHVYGRYSTYIYDRTYYDLFYIMNYSLLLDLKVLFLTTKTMFMTTKAAGEDDFKQKTIAKADLKGGETIEAERRKTEEWERASEYQKS